MNSPILDLAVVLVFTYLLLSIIASTLYEIVLTSIRARSKMLFKAFKTLFFDEAWRTETYKLVIQSPSIKALQKDVAKFPAYIPASSFANAILGLIRNGSTEPLTISTIREKLNDENSLIKGEARIALLNILDAADNEYDKFISGIEHFYDSSMDRVSGWFKLRYQYIMFIISMIITLVLNVDSIHIAKTLWANPAQLSVLADASAEQFNAIENNNGTIILTNANGDKLVVQQPAKADTTKLSADSAFALLQQQGSAVKQLINQAQNSGIPMGWQGIASVKKALKWEPQLAARIAGWIITTLAVFMGAPTWFDILSKLVNLRGTGKKPKVNSKTT